MIANEHRTNTGRFLTAPQRAARRANLLAIRADEIAANEAYL